MMTRLEIENKMQEYAKKIDRLEKKKKLWNLNTEEEKTLIKLSVQYISLKYQLVDNIFVDYIEPLLYNDNVIDLKEQLLMFSGWEGNLLFEDKDIMEFNNNVEDINLVKDLLGKLTEEEIYILENSNIIDKEIMELFSELYNGSLLKYIKTRYIVMLEIIGGTQCQD